MWISRDIVDSGRITTRDGQADPWTLFHSASEYPADFEKNILNARNFYTGEPIREEASPGNYQRGGRDAAGNQEYIIFDANGAPWSSRKPPK